jgi:hypothetical protein
MLQSVEGEFMKPEIKDLFERAENDDESIREEAALQIAMLLEKNSRIADKLDFYKNILDPQLLSLILDTEEQKEIIAELSKLIRTEKMVPAMLWALSKPTMIDTLPPLLNWLREYSHQAEEDAINQAIGAIDKVFFLNIGGDKIYEHPEVAEIIRHNDPIPFLQMIANRKPEREVLRVPEGAQKLLDRIQQELYPPDHSD